MRRMDRVCPGSACGVTLLPGLTNGYRFVVDRLDAFEAALTDIQTSVTDQRAHRRLPRHATHEREDCPMTELTQPRARRRRKKPTRPKRRTHATRTRLPSNC